MSFAIDCNYAEVLKWDWEPGELALKPSATPAEETAKWEEAAITSSSFGSVLRNTPRF